MASCLLNFLVWFGFANIATLHSSLLHIGSKAKSSVWYSWTSSFVTVVTCKLGNSDCIPRKSLFGIDLPKKAQQSKKKSRHCGDDSKATGVIEASEGYVSDPRENHRAARDRNDSPGNRPSKEKPHLLRCRGFVGKAIEMSITPTHDTES